MKRQQYLLILTLLAVLVSGCGPGPERAPSDGSVEVAVSAAASMAQALQAAQAAFTAQDQAVRIRFNFGSSGALGQQIEQGAPVDLFISAANDPMDSLVKRDLVAKAAVQPLVTNAVVLIRRKAAGGPVESWETLTMARWVAIGNPQHVPAGQYGQAVLEATGHWEATRPRLVLAEDVRQVVQYVESGEVDAGIVYATDAAASQKVVVVARAPVGSHRPVIYPMAVLKEARHAPEARRFADFLLSPEGREILIRHGFGVPE